MSAPAILDAPPVKAWPQAKLADVADIVNGGTPKSNVADFWDGEHQWLTPADMGKMVGREISQTPRTITAMGLAKSSARLAPPRSVILSTRAPIGHLAINSVSMAFNQGCRALVPGSKLDHVFLYYFLLQSRELLNDLGTGTTFKELSATSLKTVQMPLPPLEEQKRIVAVLDQAFAALDRARALAEASLADAEALLSQTVEAALCALGERQPIARHVDLLSGFAFKSGGYTDDPEDVRLIRGDNIVQGAFRWDGVKRWPKSERSVYARYELAADDVLIAMDRTWVSAGIKYAVVDEEALPSLLVQRVARLRTKSTLLPSFLAICIGSKLFERYVLDIQTGLGVPHVSGKQLEAFEVPIPDLDAQRDFVERVEAIRGKSKALMANLRTSLSDIADLRQTLIQKAFAGELT